jgi:hypothetical protein
VAVVVVCAVGGLGTAASAADKGATPNPQPLWHAYPLDETPKADTPLAPAAQREPTTRPATAPPALAPGGASSGPSWIVLLAAAAAGALFVALVLQLYDRYIARPRARRASAEVEVPIPEPRDLFSPPIRAVPAGRPPDPAALRPGTRTSNGPPNPTLRLRPSIVVIPSEKSRVDDRAAATKPEPGRAAASRNDPVCQVRWSRRAARFYAVTTEPDGTERRLARSPRFEWREPSPPQEESREAQAALRQLAKELRDKGWRPLRAKGIDFDERRWYARRFRWPTDVERGRPRESTPPPRERVPGRDGAPRR